LTRRPSDIGGALLIGFAVDPDDANLRRDYVHSNDEGALHRARPHGQTKGQPAAAGYQHNNAEGSRNRNTYGGPRQVD
jgi:hypothetical protein